jgi:peroxiredoxin
MSYWLVPDAICGLFLLVIAFALLGLKRHFAISRWRIEQLLTSLPRRDRRLRLSPGTPSPSLSLPTLHHGHVTLHDFPNDRVLLTFIEERCGDCCGLVQELNSLHQRGFLRVLVVIGGNEHAATRWSAESAPRFPVAYDADGAAFRAYRVAAIPYGFLVSRRRLIVAESIVTCPIHVRYLLSGSRSTRIQHEAQLASLRAHILDDHPECEREILRLDRIGLALKHDELHGGTVNEAGAMITHLSKYHGVDRAALEGLDLAGLKAKHEEVKAHFITRERLLEEIIREDLDNPFTSEPLSK